MSKREGDELFSESKSSNQLQSSCLKRSFPSNLLTLSSAVSCGQSQRNEPLNEAKGDANG